LAEHVEDTEGAGPAAVFGREPPIGIAFGVPAGEDEEIVRGPDGVAGLEFGAELAGFAAGGGDEPGAPAAGADVIGAEGAGAGFFDFQVGDGFAIGREARAGAAFCEEAGFAAQDGDEIDAGRIAVGFEGDLVAFGGEDGVDVAGGMVGEADGVAAGDGLEVDVEVVGVGPVAGVGEHFAVGGDVGPTGGAGVIGEAGEADERGRGGVAASDE
jgi:hypothetical protein